MPPRNESQLDALLRPNRLEDFVGQPRVREQLAIAIEAARRRGEAMDHVLLCGPAGLGKTTLAGIMARELSVAIDQTAGPVLQTKLDLTGILSNLRVRQIFFIDEIHRLQPDIEDVLYAALETFRLDILIGTGPGARTHSVALPRFTAVGATISQGCLSASLRGRFGIVLRLDPYDEPSLARIVERSARLLETGITHDAAREIARRARGTPSIANRLLRRVLDYAQIRADGHIDDGIARAALDLLKVDRYGLDEVDERIIVTIASKYGGGPVGLNTLAASIGETSQIIEEYYEPYLMALGLLDRTPRGRVVTERAFEYFQIPHNGMGWPSNSRAREPFSKFASPESKTASNGHREPDPSAEPAGSQRADSSSRDLDEVLVELNSLIGLSAAKRTVADLTNLMRVRRMRAAEGIPLRAITLHRVFTGNPGTGKTTVARVLGRIFHSLGVLQRGHLVEVDRSSLVAGYIGQTALKTQEVIKSAMDGILFIDEAYALFQEHSNDFGHEAINILLKAMEDHRDQLVVIVAGYPEPMSKFLSSNPGLKSRFNDELIHFEDYTLPELQSILIKMAKDAGYKIRPGTVDLIAPLLAETFLDKSTPFANARWVRNIFERAQVNQANRLAAIAHPDREQLITIENIDLPRPKMTK